MTYHVPHIVNGKAIEGNGRTLEIVNPALGKVIGSVGVADSQLVNETVAVAQQAYDSWSQTTPAQRAKILFKYKSLLDQNMNELAPLISSEHGKTIDEAKGSIQRGIDVVDFTCNIPYHLHGMYTDEVARGMDSYSIRQSLGVCVGITPFNFPGMIPLWMFPMAIACGNTFIVKPSEKDPSCTVKMLELAHDAGVPDGVVNVLHGDKETVDALITHNDVRAVSFVGSSKIAEYVYHTAIQHNKRAQAFGGAKNHCIVMPDADIDKAATDIVNSAYGSVGERCMAISVVVTVGDDITDQLIERIKPKIENMVVGAGDDPDTFLGALVTEQHLNNVLSFVEKGKAEGAKLVVDRSSFKPKSHQAGYFMGPCLFDEVKPEMSIYQEEIFGPVLCIVRAKNFEEALALVNKHRYGNGTSIFTRDGYTAKQFTQRVQVGMVGVNVPVPVPVAYHSFGGWKESIFADTQMYGAEAVRFYTKPKTVTQRWYPMKEAMA